MGCKNNQIYEVDLGADVPAYKTVLIGASSDEEAVSVVKAKFDAGELEGLTHNPWKAQYDMADALRVVLVKNVKTGGVVLENFSGEGAPENFLVPSILPQAFEVSVLILAALKALPLLGDGEVKASLYSAIAAFSDNVVPTAWSVADVQEMRPDLNDDEAREVLFLLQKYHEAGESDWARLSSLANRVRQDPVELQSGEEVLLRASVPDGAGKLLPAGTRVKVIQPVQGDNAAVVAYQVQAFSGDGLNELQSFEVEVQYIEFAGSKSMATAS